MKYVLLFVECTGKQMTTRTSTRKTRVRKTMTMFFREHFHVYISKLFDMFVLKNSERKIEGVVFGQREKEKCRIFGRIGGYDICE